MRMNLNERQLNPETELINPASKPFSKQTFNPILLNRLEMLYQSIIYSVFIIDAFVENNHMVP